MKIEPNRREFLKSAVIASGIGVSVSELMVNADSAKEIPFSEEKWNGEFHRKNLYLICGARQTGKTTYLDSLQFRKGIEVTRLSGLQEKDFFAVKEQIGDLLLIDEIFLNSWGAGWVTPGPVTIIDYVGDRKTAIARWLKHLAVECDASVVVSLTVPYNWALALSISVYSSAMIMLKDDGSKVISGPGPFVDWPLSNLAHPLANQ